MDELTLDDIRNLITVHASKGAYLKHVSELTGISVEVLRKRLDEKPRKPLKPTREERIRRIMEKRYNVPPALIEALIEEYESDWY
jgi:shikimate kinase